MIFPWHLYLMALIYLLAGINHFRSPKLYLKIIPPYLPNPVLLNSTTGFLQIFLAVELCIPSFSSYAAWGIMALLIAVFPCHIYMYQHRRASMHLPKWVLLSRMLLQLVLLYWAYQYT